MIELIDRITIFENKILISSIISEIQKTIFDKDIYNSFDNEQDKELYFNIFDAIHYKNFPLKSIEMTLGIYNSNINKHSKILSKYLIQLLEIMNIDELYVLVDMKIDFFNSSFNKYKPLVNALNKLNKIVSNNHYDEAFIINRNCISEFIGIIFWLSRCDPKIRGIIFFDKMEKCYFNICKYGNIHFFEINKNNITEEKLKEMGFKIIIGKETDNFSTKPSRDKFVGKDINCNSLVARSAKRI